MVTFLIAWLGLGCWVVCFWWMHRISSRQDSMLRELHEVAGRIERISQAEHALIREVHPQVGEIKEQIQAVADKVSEDVEGKTR